MTVAEMLDALKWRTKKRDITELLIELNSAARWTARRVYNSEGGPDLLSTFGAELSIGSTTKSYDLGANVPTGVFLGIKRLWLMLPGETEFTRMTEADLESPAFTANDNRLAADPLIATGHPVFYEVYNFDELRFDKALPANSKLRADYWREPPALDPTNNATIENGLDLPAVFHDAVISKATAQIFSVLDDSRVGEFETRARDEITDAIRTAGRRSQGPTQTIPFTRGRRRIL